MLSKISIFQFLIIFFILIPYSKSISLLSSSTIEKCLNKDPSKNITCSSKMLLSLTIQNAELEGSDFIETTLSQITDNDGNIQKLSSPIKITFSKTPVKVIYPSTYFQDFNYYPKEKIIKTTSTKCKDSNTETEPTCGWAYSYNNEKIPYSQGFCCSCSLISFSKSDKRGVSCDGFLDISSSAHCLIFDEVWFSAYKIEKYKIEYNIEINIINVKDNTVIAKLNLSSQNVIDSDKDNNIIVKLIGDFLPNDLHPRDLSDKYLLIPSSPENNINVKMGIHRWMLVDKTKFTLDGKECDKIGVSFFAFQSQSEKCNIEPGSCLNNQIYHLIQSDMNKIKNGENPEYLLKYDKNYDYSFYGNNINSRSFSYNLKGNINTLITLEINTSMLKFVSNVSSGKIISLYANDFASNSDDGFIEIKVMNTGYFIAQFFINYNCNDNIIQLSSDELSLKPDEIKSFNKSIYTSTNKDLENKCVVILKNSLGEKIDMKLISFNTTSEKIFNNQNISSNNNLGNSFNGNKNFLCEEECNKILNFSCYFKNSCWSMMVECIVILVLIIIIIAIIARFFKKIFCCCKCAKKIICCCCSDSEKE